jgi:hypothetical protein
LTDERQLEITTPAEEEYLNVEEGLDEALLLQYNRQPTRKPRAMLLCQRCHRLK